MMKMKELSVGWIEDDSDVIYGVVRPLEREGATIKKYYTYSEALDNIEELGRCDILLVDVILPPGRSNDKNKYLGLKLLYQIREEFKFNMPVLLFSIVANAKDVLDIEQLRRLNAYTIPKPTSPSDLKIEVMEILNI